MEPIKFSIVTPSFNQASYIEQTIRSVLDQQYPSVEHIVVDGGSTDGTLAILRRYPHIRWISEPDRGQSHAINKGFAMATGEIVGWLNSYDTYIPDSLAIASRGFEDPMVMVVCGDGFEIDEAGTILKPLFSSNATPEALIMFWKWKYQFVQPTFFFRRAVLTEVGDLDEELYYAMDVDFIIRLGQRYPFLYLREPIANLRLHQSSKTGRNISKFLPGYIREMQKVSHRFWGSPMSLQYARYAGSFIFAIALSVVKNVFFLPGSKSRNYLHHKPREAG